MGTIEQNSVVNEILYSKLKKKRFITIISKSILLQITKNYIYKYDRSFILIEKFELRKSCLSISLDYITPDLH